MKKSTLVYALALGALMSFGCSQVDTNSQPAVDCDTAAQRVVDAYDEIDRSCEQDSDCEYRSIGGCGCPVPVSTSADTASYVELRDEATAACDMFYTPPGAQGCLNAVVCDFAGDEFDVTPRCGEQGICVDPPADELMPNNSFNSGGQ